MITWLNMLCVECVEKSTRWVVNMIAGLPFSVRGRVAILGDAVSVTRDLQFFTSYLRECLSRQVHAMETHLGAGAGQSIEVRRPLQAITIAKYVNTSAGRLYPRSPPRPPAHNVGPCG